MNDILGEMFKLKLWIITPILVPYRPQSSRPYEPSPIYRILLDQDYVFAYLRQKYIGLLNENDGLAAFKTRSHLRPHHICVADPPPPTGDPVISASVVSNSAGGSFGKQSH